MKNILRTVTLFLMITAVTSCDKYKLVDVAEEKVKEMEEKIKEIEEAARKKGVVVAAPEGAPAGKTKAQTGWVKLYDDKGFSDRVLTVSFGRDIGDLHRVSSDDGKSGFNDKASAAKYSVPEGWEAVLYENNSYSKRGYSLKGSGSVPDLGYFSDKCSSIRWEKK